MERQNCHEVMIMDLIQALVNSHMLKNVGAQFVIFGHSENRAEGETDKVINLKLKVLLNQN